MAEPSVSDAVAKGLPDQEEVIKPVSMKGLDGKPASFAMDQLDAMSHADLYNLREANKDNQQAFEILAPFEHQAFAREWTKESPAIAAPSLAVATPMYYLAKQIGLMTNNNTATKPSVQQMLSGFKGIAQGLGIRK